MRLRGSVLLLGGLVHMSDDVSRETFTPCPATYRGEECELPAGHAHEHESESYLWEEDNDGDV